MRLEAEIQMTKTNCDLIHFEESYLYKSKEAFICSQAKSSQRYKSMGQAATDDSNCSSGSKPPMPGILKISECLKMQTCASKTDYNHLAVSLGISSPFKNWYITRKRAKEIYPCTPILNLKLVFRSHMTQPPLQPGQGLDHHQRRTGTQSFSPSPGWHLTWQHTQGHLMHQWWIWAWLQGCTQLVLLHNSPRAVWVISAAGWGHWCQCQLCTRAAQWWLPIFKALSL